MYSYICFTRGNISSRFNRKYSIRLEDGHVPLVLAQDFTVFLQWSMNKDFLLLQCIPKNLLVKRRKCFMTGQTISILTFDSLFSTFQNDFEIIFRIISMYHLFTNSYKDFR